MSKRFDQALKGLGATFPYPDPDRREEFLNSLPVQEKRRSAVIPFLPNSKKPFWYAIPAVAVAAVMLTVGIRTYQQNPPHQIPGVETTTTSYTETISHETQTETVTEVTSATTKYTTTPAPTTEPQPEIVPTETARTQAVSTGTESASTQARTSAQQAGNVPSTTAPRPAQSTQQGYSTEPAQSMTHRPSTTAKRSTDFTTTTSTQRLEHSTPKQTDATAVTRRTTGTTRSTTQTTRTTAATHPTTARPTADPVVHTTQASETRATRTTTQTTRATRTTTQTTRATRATTQTTRATRATTQTTRATRVTTQTTRATTRMTTQTTRIAPETYATTMATEALWTTKASWTTEATWTTRATWATEASRTTEATWATYVTTEPWTMAPIEPTYAPTWVDPAQTEPTTAAATNHQTDPTEPATEATKETQSTKPSETDSSDTEGSYTTATIFPSYKKTKTAPVWTDFEDWFDYEPGDADPWWSEQADWATDIVSGTIVNVRYTSFKGIPYTAIDVEVDNVLHGTRSGGTLTVFEPGGYIRLDDLARHHETVQQRVDSMTDEERARAETVYEKTTSLPEPVAGDRCLFFLEEDPDLGGYFYSGSPHLCRMRLQRDAFDSGGTMDENVYESYDGTYRLMGVWIRGYFQ